MAGQKYAMVMIRDIRSMFMASALKRAEAFFILTNEERERG